MMETVVLKMAVVRALCRAILESDEYFQLCLLRYFYITGNDTDSCSESGCSEGCVELPWNQMSIYRCICYDGAAKVLQEDEKTCASKINSKTCLKGPLKIDKTEVLKTNIIVAS